MYYHMNISEIMNMDHSVVGKMVRVYGEFIWIDVSKKDAMLQDNGIYLRLFLLDFIGTWMDHSFYHFYGMIDYSKEFDCIVLKVSSFTLANGLDTVLYKEALNIIREFIPVNNEEHHLN